MEDLDRIIQHIYEDNVLGKLSDSRYLKLSRQYEKEQMEMEQLVACLLYTSCVQSISCSLLCRWFRVAVLPLDESLETALLHQKEQKRCAVCGQPFLPSSNRAKHCKACAAIVHRRPVSYTHLDVYKRQGTGCKISFGRLSSPCGHGLCR